MNDAAIEDLKQFIATTVRNEVVADGDKIRKEMKEGFAGVGEAMSDMGESVDKTLDNHEQRITALESKTA
jgi:hypothetical protein